MSFSIGDWVEITHNPDSKWHRWMSTKTYYDEYCGKVGFIDAIMEDDERQDKHLYCVKVDFPNGYAGYGAGLYSMWFRDYHLIKISDYEVNRRLHVRSVEDEMQKWEEFKRKTRDDMLRYVFSPPEEEKNISTTEEKDTETNNSIWDDLYSAF